MKDWEFYNYFRPMNRKLLVPIVFSDGSDLKKAYRMGEAKELSDPSLNPSDISLSIDPFVEISNAK